MSARNTLEAKKRRRVIKALRITPPAVIDLIDYVKVRTRCTTSTAEAVLLSGALKVDSHVVGRKTVIDPLGKEQLVVNRYLPAKFRKDIQIISPELLGQ